MEKGEGDSSHHLIAPRIKEPVIHLPQYRPKHVDKESQRVLGGRQRNIINHPPRPKFPLLVDGHKIISTGQAHELGPILDKSLRYHPRWVRKRFEALERGAQRQPVLKLIEGEPIVLLSGDRHKEVACPQENEVDRIEDRKR